MRAAVATGASEQSRGADPSKAVLRLRSARLSRMDRLSALALVAADDALADAGFGPGALSALASARVAIVVGTHYGCHATNEEYFRGLLAEGPRGASPRLFTYTLPSSPLGELSLHFGARGPAQTVASGRHAGIEAIARAASLCAAGRADLALAVAVEVGGGALVEGSCSDGAAALVIEAAESALAAGRAARARIVGSGLAFVSERAAQAAELAMARAIAGAGLPPRRLVPLEVADGGGAVEPAAALAAWLRAAPAEGSLGLALASDEMGGAAALLAVAVGRGAHG